MSLSNWSSFFLLEKIAFQILIQLLRNGACEKAFCWLASRKVVFNFAQRYFSTGFCFSKAKLTIPNKYSLALVLPIPGAGRDWCVPWLPLPMVLIIWLKWALRKNCDPWLTWLYRPFKTPFSLIQYTLSGCLFVPPRSFCIWYVIALIIFPLCSGIMHSLCIPIA